MAARTKRGRASISQSGVSTGNVQRAVTALSENPVVKLPAKTMLYSTADRDSLLWQLFEARLRDRNESFWKLAGCRDVDSKLRDCNFDAIDSDRLSELIRQRLDPWPVFEMRLQERGTDFGQLCASNPNWLTICRECKFDADVSKCLLKLICDRLGIWQLLEARLAERGRNFDQLRSGSEIVLSEFGFDPREPSSQYLAHLIQMRLAADDAAAAAQSQVGVYEFYLSLRAVPREEKHAPRVFEYQLRKPLSLLPAAIAEHAAGLGANLPTNPSLNIEHLRAPRRATAAFMVQVMDAAQSDSETHGWQFAEGGGLVLRSPDVATLMKLIDDDKKAGKSQMLLTDMFTKMSIRDGRKSTKPMDASETKTSPGPAAPDSSDIVRIVVATSGSAESVRNSGSSSGTTGSTSGPTDHSFS